MTSPMSDDDVCSDAIASPTLNHEEDVAAIVDKSPRMGNNVALCGRRWLVGPLSDLKLALVTYAGAFGIGKVAITLRMVVGGDAVLM